ncbi:Fungalysin metallopeptidase-domain-containing protein [Mycena vitilis]|nr:Fungalysin metallopeptidase-domain-containing protein [Mycena vitilis]
MHDIAHKYGFTEADFNFQKNNFGNGGAANDRVTASIQDAAGTDNTDFSTPPDGQSGHMRMYLFTSTNPERDKALENDVVVHEWTEQTSATVKDYVMGTYVINDPAGIRTHPYSTSKSVNPLTYASVGTLNEVHNIGKVWANMLHHLNVYAALVGAHRAVGAGQGCTGCGKDELRSVQCHVLPSTD